MKKTILFILSSVFLLSLVSEAREREGGFHRGRPQRRGNENSQRVRQLGVGMPVANGNGCPSGTMRVSFAPDFLSFSILFDRFVAEVGTDSRQKFDNIICNALIPIEIPEGMQMEITRIDYRGFSGLPDKANGFLQSIVNFRGPGGDGDRINIRYQFKGPVMENYEISTEQFQNASSEMSPCGGKTQLRISNQLWIVARNRQETASLTLDSIDGRSNAIYYVNWKACQKNSRPQNGGRF